MQYPRQDSGPRDRRGLEEEGGRRGREGLAAQDLATWRDGPSPRPACMRATTSHQRRAGGSQGVWQAAPTTSPGQPGATDWALPAISGGGTMVP